jgi:hypothetical protein
MRTAFCWRRLYRPARGGCSWTPYLSDARSGRDQPTIVGWIKYAHRFHESHAGSPKSGGLLERRPVGPRTDRGGPTVLPDLPSDEAALRLRKAADRLCRFNPNHYPANSGRGGQFAPAAQRGDVQTEHASGQGSVSSEEDGADRQFTDEIDAARFALRRFFDESRRSTPKGRLRMYDGHTRQEKDLGSFR